jgi:hypothetical protein
MIHLVAEDKSSLPLLKSNTLLQAEGGFLGQYGSTEEGIPPMLIFDKAAGVAIGDTEAKLVFAQLPKD